MSHESFFLALSGPTLAKLEPAVRALADAEWEDDIAQMELVNFANELRARMQAIAADRRKRT